MENAPPPVEPIVRFRPFRVVLDVNGPASIGLGCPREVIEHRKDDLISALADTIKIVSKCKPPKIVPATMIPAFDKLNGPQA